jgi:hypothetical protein
VPTSLSAKATPLARTRAKAIPATTSTTLLMPLLS